MKIRIKALSIIAILIGIACHILAVNPNQRNGLKSKKIKIGSETYNTLSGTIQVPEDYSRTESKLIRLPIYIIKTNNLTPSEPVFILNGGPGSSNIQGTKNNLLLKNHDFVSIGYRGVDGEVVLTSKKLRKASKGLNNSLLSDESLNNFKSVVDEYFKETEATGLNLSHYTIIDVVEDLNYVKNQLGYDKINLLSISYGTRVSLLFDYKYPNTIKRTIMVGANPPGYFIWWPRKTSEIINIYDSLYFHQAYKYNHGGSIRAAMNKAFSEIPKRWAFIKLDVEKIKIGVFTLMYQRENSVIAFDAIFRAAYKKDYSGLCAIQKLYNFFSNKNVWGDMFIKGLPIDYNPNFNYLEALKSDTASPLGANYSLLLWGAVPKDFSISVPEYYKLPHNTNTETLIISGELDVSTPADYAKEKLLPYLSNGKQIVLKNMSHGDLIFAQIDNYRQVVSTYFDQGIVMDSGGFKNETLGFNPKRNLCRLAKLLYPVMIFIN